MEIKEYDLTIIGAGPAGLTAGLYSSRAKIKTLILENYLNVSQIGLTDMIENYPGFVEPISGMELLEKMRTQTQKFGAEIVGIESINKIYKENNFWYIETDKFMIKSIAVIVASGAKPKELNVEGENKYKGRGVSYCAVCDAPFYKNKIVSVIGGGDTALEEALYLTKFASKVFLIHRRNMLRATKILQERAFNNNKIEFVWNSVVNKIIGNNNITGIEIKNLVSNEYKILKCDGVFIAIGYVPNTSFVKDIVKTDEQGYIIVDSEMKTGTEGIFAAGDCVRKILRQVSTAVGDGALASESARLYIEKFKGIEYK
jgi:thioredoxin reductase (NADPH)